MAALRPVTLDHRGIPRASGGRLPNVFAANRHEVVLVARREQLPERALRPDRRHRGDPPAGCCAPTWRASMPGAG